MRRVAPALDIEAQVCNQTRYVGMLVAYVVKKQRECDLYDLHTENEMITPYFVFICFICLFYFHLFCYCLFCLVFICFVLSVLSVFVLFYKHNVSVNLLFCFAFFVCVCFELFLFCFCKLCFVFIYLVFICFVWFVSIPCLSTFRVCKLALFLFCPFFSVLTVLVFLFCPFCLENITCL